MSRVFLGIGSNLGDRIRNIKKALDLLAKNQAIQIIKMSSIYETEPEGVFEEQPLFLNAVLEISTEIKPQKLLKILQEIETSLGRVRETPLAPREIDLDILFYDEIIISTDSLIIPHPLISERAFVLVPLNEIAPDFVHPVFKLPVSRLFEFVHGKEKVKIHQKDKIIFQ